MHRPLAHDDPTTALLALILAGGRLAPRRRLLIDCGDAVSALAAGRARWQAAGLDRRQCQALLAPDADALAHARQWLAASPQHRLISLVDDAFPALLAHAPEPPLGLFVAGDADLLWQPMVAIVGSRSATPSGQAIAGNLARQLCARQLCVASGLAAGIDAAAHRASLQVAGNSVAVVGTGLDRCYPAGHRHLQDQLVQRGAVISEYAPGTPPRAGNFPARNRLLAGLSLAVIVVEAAQRSGAMITARLASEAGREVFAVPGSPLNPLSRGCNRLLRDGAGLLESIDDLLPTLPPLLRLLGTSLPGQAPGAASVDALSSGQVGSSALDETEQRQVWQALDLIGVDLDELGQRSGLTVARLSAILLDLELAGWALQTHGRWQRAPTPPSTTASIDAG